MTRAIPFPLLLIVLGCAIGYPSTRLEGQAESDDEKTIRDLEDRVRLGVLNRDLEELQLLWSEHLMVNAPTNRVAPNRAFVLDLMQKGLIHYSSLETTIEHVRVDGDVAIVMGRESVQPIGNAPLAGQTVERRYTHIWKNDGGTWRLIARHANNITSSPGA